LLSYLVYQQNNGGWLATPNSKEAETMNAPLIGEAFTTQSSGVTGTVQEVIKNSTGSLRVRLDVNGQDRWTTVK